MCNVLKFTQNNLVLIPYLLTYSHQCFLTTLLRHIVFISNVFCFNGDKLRMGVPIPELPFSVGGPESLSNRVHKCDRRRSTAITRERRRRRAMVSRALCAATLGMDADTWIADGWTDR